MSISSIHLNFFHLNIISMALYMDILLHFIKYIQVYCCNLSILWFPLKNWIHRNVRIANFGHPVSKSWLRPCQTLRFHCTVKRLSVTVSLRLFDVAKKVSASNCRPLDVWHEEAG